MEGSGGVETRGAVSSDDTRFLVRAPSGSCIQNSRELRDLGEKDAKTWLKYICVEMGCVVEAWSLFLNVVIKHASVLLLLYHHQ